MRGPLLVVASLVLLAALLWFPTVPAFWAVAIWAAVLIVGLLFERYRYRPKETSRTGWVATDESFIDPETRRLMRVEYHPGTGERRYVSTGPAP